MAERHGIWEVEYVTSMVFLWVVEAVSVPVVVGSFREEAAEAFAVIVVRELGEAEGLLDGIHETCEVLPSNVKRNEADK